jgi:3-oxoacyl-[acyl-carrier protein] reductase
MFEVTADDFDMFMAVNARAPLLLTQRLGSRMLSGGSIVNVSSMGAQFSSPGDIVYAMSKAALESLTLHAAQAFATRGIRINTVIPGFTDNGNPAFADPRTLAYMSGYSSLGGVAQADAVADGVAFLVSDASRRTTGASLDVSGGGLLGSHPNRIAGSVHAGSD